MMSRATPWDDISKPDVDYNVRLVSGTGQIPVFWGKDAVGHCILALELEGDHSEQFRKSDTSIHGIGVDLRRGDEPRQQRLILTLEKHVDRDLFFGLCETLIARLIEVTDSSVAFEIAFTHIKRWKAFLASRNSRVLTPEDIRGLFAELYFLRTLYQKRMSHKAAVEAWCGADGAHQDFIFGDTAVEIKSLSGRERSAVRISSEDQLEALTTTLFLVVYKLSDLPESNHAVSLNDLVSAIENELMDADVLEQFSHKVAAYGYVPLMDYEVPRLMTSSTQVFRVVEGFPRLVRSLIPTGIARLSYDIELEKLLPFTCDMTEILEGS
jgi:Putative  PD-(D/E)XK family member, (DUF4420)